MKNWDTDLQMPRLRFIWRDDKDNKHYENDDLQWQWGETSMTVYDYDKTTSSMEDQWADGYSKQKALEPSS